MAKYLLVTRMKSARPAFSVGECQCVVPRVLGESQLDGTAILRLALQAAATLHAPVPNL
jgi:hypothetical protein